MKDRLINKLELFFDKDVLYTKQIPERYFYDESTIYSALPDAVFLPSSIDELNSLITIAKEERINIIPRGMGTGVCGGAVAINGGIVVSLERMNKIIDLDEKNMLIVTQPGVITGEIKNHLATYGFFYPPDPQSYESSSIGGNVATNAGGPKAVKYGTTKDYVMSLTFVTGDGKIIKSGGKTYKNSSGYNLNELLCGSEGTVGLITEITLKFLPMPSHRRSVFIPFKVLKDACDFLGGALKKGIDFSAFEFIDDTSKMYIESFLKRKLPFTEIANCYIFGELENENADEIEKIIEIASKFNALDVFTAEGVEQEERLWEARKKISEAFKSNSKYIYKADIVVPRGNIADFVSQAKTFSSERLPLACFGHVGDGNVHINILDLDGNSTEDASKVMWQIMNCVKNYGGFPSGEHGIGVAKKAYLPMFFPEEHITLLKQLKKVFDPYHILNIGKIF